MPATQSADLETSPATVPSAPRRTRTRHRPRLTRRLTVSVLLLASLASLLLSVPGLRPVLHELDHLDAGWVAVAVGLEVAACVSFVVLFRRFFDRLAGRDARPLAWANMGSGALLPGGGAGGMAVGGWLVRRSGGLFFLTTAVNAASVIGAGVVLGCGISRPNGFALAWLPVLIVVLATAAVLVAAHRVNRRPAAPAWMRALAAGVRDAEVTTLGHPHWRLLGSLGYLGFDMAVLWVSLAAVGEHFSVPALLIAYNLGDLASSLPVPGGIGVLDAGLAGSLILYGAGPAHAAAAVLIYHAIAFWVPGLGGVLAYASLHRRLIDPTARSGAPLPTPATVSGGLK